jgi:hypothetical protein
MTLWAIGWDEAVDLDLAACEVVTLFNAAGHNLALIDCDDETTAELRTARGVTSLVPARDGETYVDGAGSGMTVIVEANGTGWREL